MAYPRTRLSAFTLIEVMLVIAVIGLVMMGATTGLGALTRSNLRAASMKVVSASRFAYNRAVTQGNTTRVHFDFERNTMSVQESTGGVLLDRDEEAELDAVDPWAQAKARLETPNDPIQAPSRFGPIKKEGVQLKKFDPQPIGDGIKVVKIITPRAERTETDLEGAIHFFPGGMTEHTVVHLSDRSEHVFAIEIHPLTGHAEIHNYAYEPEEVLDDETSEVRDRS